MAGDFIPQLPFRVRSPDGSIMARVRRPEHAAALAALLGDGATVVFHRRHTVWTQGADRDAGPGLDAAAIIADRVRRSDPAASPERES